MSLKQIQKLIWRDKTDLALQEISNLQDKDYLSGLIYKSIILTQKRDVETALSLVEPLLSNNKHQLNISQEFGARVAKIQALMRGSRFFEAFNEIDLCDEILLQMNQTERNNVKDFEGKLFSIKSGFQIMGGKIEEAFESLHKSLALFEDIQYKKEIYYQLNNLGWIYRVQGKLDQALDCFQKQLKISQEMEDKKTVSWSKFNLAYINFYKGELNQASEYAHESLNLFQELESNTGLAQIYTVIGSVHRGKGELDRSLDYYNMSLEIHKSALDEQRTVPHSVCVSLRDLGIVYYHKNEIQKSIEYFTKATETHKSLCQYKNTLYDFEIALSNFWLINVCIETDHLHLVEKLLEEIKQVSITWPWLEILRRAAEAYILKSRPRAKDKIRAQQILEEILEDHFDYELKFGIQVSLCDLLLDELKFYGEEQVIQEIQELLSRISTTAKNQRSITTLVTLYILQAKLALVEGDAEKSSSLLSRAESIAKTKGLKFLEIKVKAQQDLLFNQLEEWKAILDRNSSLQERIDVLNLNKYLNMVHERFDLLEKKFESQKKFELIYEDLVEVQLKIPKRECRVGVAQIGVSHSGNLLTEFYFEKTPGFFSLKEEKIATVLKKVINLIETASRNGVNIIVFPELAIDLNYHQVTEALLQLAKKHVMYIIPGSYHHKDTHRNISPVFSPDGILWEQEKHIPALIHVRGKRIKEAIDVSTHPRRTIICNTEYGRIAIVICRDFLDLDLRVELKNFTPPIDLLFNPAFTPVTADFQAAHFDARRSIYAYCFFANIAEFGNSQIFSPEKDRTEQKIIPKEEQLIYKDVDVFKLRSERKKWEMEQKKDRPFIQSTKY
ncbi:MAG: tetratricopeptide repeat protein [Candidatus Hodarchaeales archaeon]|jgi:predicted amidohydrolase/Trp operon repressor